MESLYINPLLDILSKQNPPKLSIGQASTVNGVFDTSPEQSLVLLIDFKTAGSTLWPYVQAALEPLRHRDYLTRSNGTNIITGPITIVGTGNTPFDLVNSDRSNPHHDIFFDAPLSNMFDDFEGGITTSTTVSTSVGLEHTKSMVSPPNDGTARSAMPVPRPTEKRADSEGQGKSGTSGINPGVFNVGNSYYASVAFGEVIGPLQDGQFSKQQLHLLRGQIRGAHKRGLKARYWDLPFWPIGLRNHVWEVLVKEGVDMLNVDDLEGATRRDWSKHHGWWTISGTNSQEGNEVASGA